MFGLGLAGGFVAALIGVMSITSEFRHGTIRPTFIFTPRRGRVWPRRSFRALALGAALRPASPRRSRSGPGSGSSPARGAELVLSPRELLLVVFGSVAVTALMAALGVGVGAVSETRCSP